MHTRTQRAAATAAACAVAAIMAAHAAATVSPDRLDYAARRTADIRNCSAVILPPGKDKDGNWHWFAASARHCSSGARGWVRKLIFTYPKRVECQAQEVYASRSADVMILEFLPPDGQTPYAELADPADVTAGQEVLITGFPAAYSGNPYGGLVWKTGRITGVGGREVTVSASLRSGNSGGPLWTADGKVAGVASTTSDGSSGWAGPVALHDAYHRAQALVGVTPDCQAVG